MPTAGTHVTIVQRLALELALQPLLGSPDPGLKETDPQAVKMRFACLGACGPDIFYAMADYDAPLQDLENFLVKLAGTTECLAELSAKTNRVVTGAVNDLTDGIFKEIQTTSALISGLFSEAFMALIVGLGVNLWPVFEPARQKDAPREDWFWADYLHYVRSGQFTQNLLTAAEKSGNANLRAYAYGYLTHYITDVIGHPYVNQVVQGPWRTQWQRHHVVENFIDAYVWDRWHKTTPRPMPGNPADEDPLDTTLASPNPMGAGAPYTKARVNDWINIGSATLGDPVDMIVDAVCMQIADLLKNFGVAIDLESPPSQEADFKAWTKLVSDTIQMTYDERHPQRLAIGPDSRPGGYPAPDDVAGAYGVFRLVQRIATEEKIAQPVPPDILTDITMGVQKLLDAVAADLAGIPAPPPVPGGSFSLASILAALMAAALWLAAVAAAVGKAVADLVNGMIALGQTLADDLVKMGFFLLDSALFAAYQALRDVLVLQGYAVPYTSELNAQHGPLNLSTLWRSNGDLPVGQYPREEVAAQRTYFGSSYNPSVPPGPLVEQPPVDATAPYRPTVLLPPIPPKPFGPGPHVPFPHGPHGPLPVPFPPIVVSATPDAFIERAIKDDMFTAQSPASVDPTPGMETFGSASRDFGGALDNCQLLLRVIADTGVWPAGGVLPDYNMDGDRGYAWPCWDVEDPVVQGPPPVVTDSLVPDAQPGMVATVRAIPDPVN